MHRFFLPSRECAQPVLHLRDAEAHHAAHVLRLRAGEEVIVLDGAGTELTCECLGRGPEGLALKVRRRRIASRLPCHLTLVQALPKSRTMDTIVQKATELGASRIVPVIAERTVVHLDQRGESHKLERWRATILEAAKQCGATWLPELDAPVALAEFIQRREPFDLTLLASLHAGARPPRAVFDGYRSEHKTPPATVALWVGPEGDFTPVESAMICRNRAQPISLGPLTLRSDTAALYGLAVLNHEFLVAPGPTEITENTEL
jgi:16S rRNA (uracil1498-N3)-methyltransferase